MPMAMPYPHMVLLFQNFQGEHGPRTGPGIDPRGVPSA